MEATLTVRVSNPLPVRQRAEHIDVIRGVAVFGLLWSNLNAGFYTGPLTSADVAARWASAVFSGGKFFTLFSLLFGVTLAMQIERADLAATPVPRFWLRRMIALFGIGWAHALLFWPGDILRDYALCGAVLLLFRRTSSRTVLIVAAVALALAGSRQSVSALVTRAVGGDAQAVSQRETPNAEQESIRRAFEQAMRSGSYVDVVGARLRLQMSEWGRRASAPAGPLNWISTWYLGLFLVGLVLGRTHIVQQPERHRQLLARITAGAFTVGIPMNIAVARPELFAPALSQPAAIVSKLVLGFGYLAGLLWLLIHQTWRRRLRWLAPVGRLGLTNYIAQTAFITTLKLNYGLGLEPVLGWFACLLIAVAFYLFQVVASNWWVRHFTFGPVEWIWRLLTYGNRVQFRLSTAGAV